MIIKVFDPSEVDNARVIHDKFYKSEFKFPDFLKDYHSVFSILNDTNKEIITVGGIRPIAEIVALTNKDCSSRAKREALINLFQAILFSADNLGYKEVHTFVQDNSWMSHLIKNGFNPTKGKSLVYQL